MKPTGCQPVTPPIKMEFSFGTGRQFRVTSIIFILFQAAKTTPTYLSFSVGCARRKGASLLMLIRTVFLQSLLAKEGKAPFCADSHIKLEYSYHFDAALLGQYLKKIAITRGIRYRSCKVTDVQRTTDGSIHQLHTAEGEILAADFYFDCTGFSSKLMRQTLDSAFHRYQQMLPNNAALTIATQAEHRPLSQTTATALRQGWCWQIPLQHRTGKGYVFSPGLSLPIRPKPNFGTILAYRSNKGAADY